jgi:hypothetical protein
VIPTLKAPGDRDCDPRILDLEPEYLLVIMPPVPPSRSESAGESRRVPDAARRRASLRPRNLKPLAHAHRLASPPAARPGGPLCQAGQSVTVLRLGASAGRLGLGEPSQAAGGRPPDRDADSQSR